MVEKEEEEGKKQASLRAIWRSVTKGLRKQRIATSWSQQLLHYSCLFLAATNKKQ